MDGPGAKVRDTVRVVFANEKVCPTMISTPLDVDGMLRKAGRFSRGASEGPDPDEIDLQPG